MVGSLVTRKIRGLETGWISTGDKSKPILLLLHGYPDTPESWEFQIENFREDFHIIAPYTRGARPSESPTDNLSRYSLPSTVLDLLEILKVENPDKNKDIYCIGHDMGTLQAWEICPLLGKRVKGLVSISGLSLNQAINRLSKLSQLRKSWYIYLFLLPYIPNALAQRFPAGILKLAHKLGKLPTRNRGRLSKAITGVVKPLNQYKAIVRSLPPMVTEALRGESHVAKLHSPVLIIYGDKEPFLDRPQRDEFLSQANNLTIRIVEGGHWPHRENAPSINGVLEDFFYGNGS